MYCLDIIYPETKPAGARGVQRFMLVSGNRVNELENFNVVHRPCAYQRVFGLEVWEAQEP